MKTRREPPRRLGNVALLALMLCSLVALSLIRGRFAPIVTSAAGDAVKSDDMAAAVSNIDTSDGADQTAAAEAAAAGEKDKDKEVF